MGLFTETKRVALGNQITDVVSRANQSIQNLIEQKNQLIDLRKTASEDTEFLPEDVIEIDTIISDVNSKISAI